jgi:protein-S-isoprenylcysteine O-methyltransferase Ste14
MPAVGLALLALYGLLAFGVRIAFQLNRTGSTGFAGLHGSPGSVRWACELGLATLVVLCLAGGPILQLLDGLPPIGVLDGSFAGALGVTLASLGIATTVLAQFAMGDAWRIGVEESEQTDLVTGGPFTIVRNPIYTAMIPAFTGIALLAPNIVTLTGAMLVVVALELQTRLIEEPHLAAIHGEQYATYAASVGRFLPGIGRL